MSGAGSAEEPGIVQRHDQGCVERLRGLEDPKLALSAPTGVHSSLLHLRSSWKKNSRKCHHLNPSSRGRGEIQLIWREDTEAGSIVLGSVRFPYRIGLIPTLIPQLINMERYL
jgi:hypothetical protein